MSSTSYQIKLPQFEGPFDLLLFFIERDELDIYNIPIARITADFLEYIHKQENLNIELSSEFILFISTLMRIKAKMLLPRKDIDAAGNEIDPRQELVDKILEYKRYKEAAIKMAEMEAERILQAKRGNLQQDMMLASDEAGEGTEIQTITLFRLMKTYEKVMKRLNDRVNKPQHVVFKYDYTMQGSREYVLQRTRQEGKMEFIKIFESCQNRIHAIFLFLSLLELAQQQHLTIVTTEGRNNFIVEWNDEQPKPEVEGDIIVSHSLN